MKIHPIKSIISVKNQQFGKWIPRYKEISNDKAQKASTTDSQLTLYLVCEPIEHAKMMTRKINPAYAGEKIFQPI